MPEASTNDMSAAAARAAGNNSPPSNDTTTAALTPQRDRTSPGYEDPRDAVQASVRCLTRRGGEPHGQALDAGHQRNAHRVERHGRAGRLDVRQPREQLAERDRDLPAGEVGAEAEVRAGATGPHVRG